MDTAVFTEGCAVLTAELDVAAGGFHLELAWAGFLVHGLLGPTLRYFFFIDV